MLTEMQIKKAKAPDKKKKLHDEKGLYLLLTPAGGKLWRMNYRFDGKYKTLSFGMYPDVKLAIAREKRDAARSLLASGVDPGAEKILSQQSSQHTIAALAREWYDGKAPEWSDKHKARMLSIIERDLPMIGNIHIADLQAPQIEQTLKTASTRSVEMARRLQTILREVYAVAIRRGIIQHSPMPAMAGVLPTVKYTHMAAPTDPAVVGQLMRSIDDYDGNFVTRCALRLAPRLFCRPGELRFMEWAEVDLKARRWVIPAEKMKMSDPLIVPLAKQCIAILKEIQPLTGHGKYVFPSVRSTQRPISDNTVNAALRRMGWDKTEITGHGFRAMARTLLDEVLRFPPDAIEAQLAHRVPDRLGRAYNRTLHLETRVSMMQEWADYLERLKET